VARHVTKWGVGDDSVGIHSGRKSLEVSASSPGGGWFFTVEYTTYTGQFSARGRVLANRLAKLLNEIDDHRESGNGK
jgi:hypothetical protein